MPKRAIGVGILQRVNLSTLAKPLKKNKITLQLLMKVQQGQKGKFVGLMLKREYKTKAQSTRGTFFDNLSEQNKKLL